MDLLNKEVVCHVRVVRYVRAKLCPSDPRGSAGPISCNSSPPPGAIPAGALAMALVSRPRLRWRSGLFPCIPPLVVFRPVCVWCRGRCPGGVRAMAPLVSLLVSRRCHAGGVPAGVLAPLVSPLVSMSVSVSMPVSSTARVALVRKAGKSLRAWVRA